MIFQHTIMALANVFQPISLLAISAGIFMGIVIGGLPGLSATMGVALLLPLTYGLEPGVALPMLMALYSGAMYGGSISAILIHTPGTPAAAATCLDGYPMALNGQGGRALGFSLTASFFGGIVSAVVLLLVAPPLSRVSLLFGPPEYFTLALLGLTLIGTLSKGNWIKGLIAGTFGLLLSTVGMDPVLGESRFTFGQMNLLGGIPMVVALIGMFSISQALLLMENKDKEKKEAQKITDRLFPSWAEIMKMKVTFIRSALLGTFTGMIPGTGGDLATWIGYNEAKRSSKDPDSFGKGNPEGVVASEAANNGVTGGALIPLLTLGIPGSSTTAVLLGGLLVHGLRPGPKFMTEYGELSLTVIFSVFVGYFIMLAMGYFLPRLGVYITKVRDDHLAPVIIILSVIGTYAIHNNIWEVGLMFVFGLLGYVMVKHQIPTAPLVLGLILGPIAENGYVQSMLISRGSWSIFITKPVSLIMVILTLLSLGQAIFKDMFKKRSSKEQGEYKNQIGE